MSRQTIRHSSEWLFIAILAVLCALLTILQHRWTGELARAEVERMSGTFKQEVEQLCNDFDQTLEDAVTALEPSAAEIQNLGLQKAHLQAWQRWQATSPRPLFSRISVAEVKDRALIYHEMQLTTGELKVASWPTEWTPLRDVLEDKIGGGGPPFNDPWGLVFEVPVFGNRGEIEWLLLELDEKYIANTWLPDLVRTRLTLDGRSLGQVRVTAARERSKTIYQSTPTWKKSEEPFSMEFNRNGRSLSLEGKGPPSVTVWNIEALRAPEAIEQLVATARWRNLGVALVLNTLILAAGILLVRHTRRSRELAQQQMQFVATVSHELRTPLSVIKGAAHNLRQGIVQDPEKVNRYLDVIGDNTSQLSSMVEQLLAHAGAQRADLSSKVDVSRLIHDAIEACQPEIQAAGCQLETKIDPSLPPVQGDPAALKRVIQNLLQNAAKHAAHGRWIGLSARAENGAKPPCVEIIVADRGPGIPKEEQASIFEPFVRGSTAVSAQTRGSGLGLSLVKEIVSAHRGHVHLQSSPEGSRFVLSLPQAPLTSAT